jgi:taurine dioxygenase
MVGRAAARISSQPLSKLMGAEVEFDASGPMSDDEFKEIFALFNRYQVLAFRDQKLSPDGQIAFSAKFGKIAGHVMGGWTRGIPEIHVITNVDKDGQITGRLPDEAVFAAGTNNSWIPKFHTDKSYMPRPALMTSLYAVEIPSEGGDTLFANMYSAYEALPQDLMNRLVGKRAVHSLEKSRLGGRPATEEEKRAAPPVSHPILQVHPDTGKNVVYCGTHAEAIVGLSKAEGQSLLDELIAHCTRPEFILRHRWRKGDLVIWDNRSLLHAATPFDPQKERRIMHRTAVEQSDRI